MARRSRKIAGLGAADLPNQAAIDAYVGPNREVIAGTDTLHLQDGVTPGGIPMVSLKRKLLAPFTGAIPRFLLALLFSQCHATAWGVEANTDESQTDKLRAAISYCETWGAKLILPHGIITLGAPTGDADAVLRITKLMSMEGTRATRFKILDEVGTRHILLIKPLANGGGIRGMVLRDFQIGEILGQIRAGGDGIRVETTNTNGFVAKLLVENVAVNSAGAGKYSFQHFNDAAANLTGGMFASTIRCNDFFGGTKFVQTGDSNNIIENIITGPNEGIYYEAVNGAATARIVGNNITATGDTIYVKGGQQIKILENQLEAVGAYSGAQASPAIVTIDGSADVVLRNNNMNAYTTRDVVAAINATGGVRIEPNTATYAAARFLLRAVNSPGIVVQRMTLETVGGVSKVGQSQISADAASVVFGQWQSLTLKNSWVNGQEVAFRQGLFFMPMEDGTVRLGGVVGQGTSTAGTTIATLPAGYRPMKAIRLAVSSFDATNGWNHGVMIVDIAGNINVQFLKGNTVVMFDGLSFSTRA